MSKVDLSIFADFIEKYAEDRDGSSYIYGSLFNGDLDCFNLPSSWKNSAERQAILDEYDYEFMEGDTGGEGEGEYCYGVIRFRGNYYKAEWSYYSYNGCDYDNITSTIREVFPKQVMVTQYSDKP